MPNMSPGYFTYLFIRIFLSFLILSSSTKYKYWTREKEKEKCGVFGKCREWHINFGLENSASFGTPSLPTTITSLNLYNIHRIQCTKLKNITKFEIHQLDCS